MAVALAGSCTPAPVVLDGLVPDAPPGATVANEWGADLVLSPTDVPYGPEDHQRLDVLPADGSTRRGTIVFVHGGGFTIGDRTDLLIGAHGAIVHQRARGWDVVTVGYLVRAGSYPQPYHDVALAVSWVREHGATIGLDTSTVVLAGHSAGGSLAAMVATTPGAPTPYGTVPRVDAWVSVSALHDWEHGGRYVSDPWGMPAGDRIPRSTLTTLDPTDPPGYLVHADDDPIVRASHSTNLWERARRIGASVQYDLVDSGPLRCRLHEPLCGADATALAQFLDAA